MAKKMQLGVEANFKDKGAEKGLSKLSNTLNKTAKRIRQATMVAGGALIAVGVSAAKQYSELEQNLGGSEAVFGKFAERIQKTGAEAFKNLGASQSDYLASANRLGSLFQGSGMSQQKSLQLTQDAMQRAGDVASVMGIRTESAFMAIEGAAKGNFGMMDNLGVAMNISTLKAYALEKGINFDWNTASNAEKAQIAMDMFFDRTEHAAGNFAKEADSTISGSFGQMKAAWENFQASLANPDPKALNRTADELVKSIVTVAKVITPVALRIGKNLAKTIVKGFMSMPIGGKIAAALAGGAVAASWLAPLVGIVLKLGKAFKALGLLLAANPIGIIIAAITALGIGLVVLYKKNETFRRVVNKAWDSIKKTVVSAIKTIAPTVQKAWDSIKNAFARSMPTIRATLAVFGSHLRALGKVIAWLSPYAVRLIKIMVAGWRIQFKAIGVIVRGLHTVVVGTVNRIVSAFRTGFSRVSAGVRAGIAGARAAITGLGAAVTYVKNLGSRAYNAGKGLVQSIIRGIRSLKIPLPRFNVGWKEFGKGKFKVSLPSFSVNWFARGGIVDGAQLVGVGESGPEAIVPLGHSRRATDDRNRVMRDAGLSAGGGNTFNIYTNNQDPRAIAKRIAFAMSNKGFA